MCKDSVHDKELYQGLWSEYNITLPSTEFFTEDKSYISIKKATILQGNMASRIMRLKLRISEIMFCSSNNLHVCSCAAALSSFMILNFFSSSSLQAKLSLLLKHRFYYMMVTLSKLQPADLGKTLTMMIANDPMDVLDSVLENHPKVYIGMEEWVNEDHRAAFEGDIKVRES